MKIKKAAALALSLFIFFSAGAQHKEAYTLRMALNKAVTDTDRYTSLHALSKFYFITHPDSAIIYEQQALLLATKNKWENNQARSFNNMANAYNLMGDYANSIRYYLKALIIYEHINSTVDVVMVDNNIGDLYAGRKDNKKALAYLLPAKNKLQQYSRNHQLPANRIMLKPAILEVIGNAYLGMGKADSARHYFKAAEQSSSGIKDYIDKGVLQDGQGQVDALKGNTNAALQYYRQALISSNAVGNGESVSDVYLDIAELYHKNKLQDSAIHYAKKALEVAQSGNFQPTVLDAANELYNYYSEAHNLPLAFKYFKLSTNVKDSLYSQDKVKQLLTLDFDEKERQQELQAAQSEAQNRLRTYFLCGGLGVLLLLALIFWRNSRHRHKANKLLKRQKEDIEKAMLQLKLTQNQLIQSEKMASLGELTSGIAHEIQNPLNFVNNFSEVNREMLEELRAESEKPKAERDGKLETELINDLIKNEQKINHHGKRADAIVKGMLQHSRSSGGEKQPTDMNTLADEFMRLAYHGLRAKDKSFNAEMVTSFDPDLPLINVVPQDIGRVMLNLFNNAFYAVNQKQKTKGTGYKPEVSITTSSENRQIVIKIKDNGTGIPDVIKEKIMQPFFTTKPTGEGTGLGLSLTYDMVVKGHGGSIQVNSKEGEGSEFIIQLPIS